MTSAIEPRAVALPPERIGKYEVFPAFARGGMATIHVGRLRGPSGFSKLVALKRLTPALAESTRHAQMLLEEARVAARIRSTYVVAVQEVLAEQGRLCLVMELIHGVPLATLLQCAGESGERLPPAVAVAIVADALRGLHAAHEAVDADGRPLDLVHRDISPQNILVGADGVARVLDFGVARALGREPLSVTGEVKGKLGYMPPEQLSGGPVTRQADVYAAGIVLWEALVGERLRNGTTLVEVGASLLQDAPRPSSRVAGLAPELDDVVAEATATDASRRFATAEAMGIALEEACAPASRDAVARFVERVAFDPLELLAKAIEAAERAGSAVDAAGVGSAEAGSATDLVAVPSRRQWYRGVLVGALIGVCATAIAATIAVFRDRRFAGPPTVADNVPASKLSPPVVPTSSVATLATAPDSYAPAAAASSYPAETAGASKGTARGFAAVATGAAHAQRSGAPARSVPSVPRAVAAPASRAATSPRASCTPPYELDEMGNKHYRQECIP